MASSYPAGSAGVALRRVLSEGNPARTWLIFYHETVADMAQKLKTEMGSAADLSALEWNHFNDGFPDLKVKEDDAQRLEQYFGTCLILSFHSPALIFEQLCLLYALPRMRARNFRIILPWFSTGTMERVETMGQIATAASLARMLSACPMGPSGPATVVIYDIHALQEQFYFSDNVLVELKTAVWLFKQAMVDIKKASPDEEFCIVFPDDGAHKRFKAKFPEYDHIVCNKVREGDERKVVIKEGSPEKKHCVIIDDLVQSGGTLLECAKPLKAGGAAKISCFVTHGVFPKESYNKFLDNELIDTFWITDSVPSTAKIVDGKKPFKVLSLAPLISQYLQGLAES